MPTVTGVIERRGRAKVFIDGELWAELDAGVSAERGLCEGVALSHEALAEARVAGEKPLAMNRALNILGYRARAESELRERLLRAGYVRETVDEVITRLAELGYLDDEEFARDLTRAQAHKRYGPRRILGALRRAGIDEEMAREAVEEKFLELSEYETALALARRRYNTQEDFGAQKTRDAKEQGSVARDAVARRVYSFLQRRGYSAEVCAEVARQYRRETDE